MSFFDDPEEPRRPRRRPAGRPPARGATAAAPVDQQILVRRAVAAGVGVLVLVLLVLGVRGCLNSRAQDALRDLNREVSSIREESDRDVGRELFRLLAEADADNAVEVRNQVNELRVTSERLVTRAEDLDPPDDVVDAHDDFLLVLELRRDAVGNIAERLPAALSAGGDETGEAIRDIAAQMRAFDASDVVFSQRVAPLVLEALNDAGVTGQQVQTSEFISDLQWLQPQFVANQLGAQLQDERRRGGDPAPGTHGHGLESVQVGDVTLQPGTANRVPAGADLAFEVAFQNQGENDEFEVPVTIQIEGSGDTIRARRTVEQTSAGQPATATIPLTDAPPLGTPVEVTVTVGEVPGEEMTENNTQTYPVLFER